MLSTAGFRLESYPEPILPSVEEALRLEEAGEMGAVYAATDIR